MKTTRTLAAGAIVAVVALTTDCAAKEDTAAGGADASGAASKLEIKKPLTIGYSAYDTQAA